MSNRQKIITYALMSNGDYLKTKKMILENPDVEDLSKGIECITILDDGYPKELFQLRYPPFVLFYDGLNSCVPGSDTKKIYTKNLKEGK